MEFDATALPDTFSVEVDGKPMLLRDTPFVKEAPDLGTLIKNGYDSHREVGARVPVKVSKPEDVAAWRATHLPTLYKNGLLDAPPASPEEYDVKPPEGAPKGLVWNAELGKKFATTLHKYGVPKAAVAELQALNIEQLTGAQAALKTSQEEGVAALKKEFGADYDKRYETASRLTAALFKTKEELDFMEQTGIANHPTFLSLLMRLAPLVESDSSVLAGLPASSGGGMTGDEVRKELADIMSNKENPKHALYWRKDKATMEYIDGLYKKAYGDGQVALG